MSAFDDAWRVIKGEHLYYNIHITPRNVQEQEALFQMESELRENGVTFDTGGMRDWHLDFSLQGTNKDTVLATLAESGIPYDIEMIASDIPPHGTPERWDYDNPDQPYADAQGVDEAPCPECNAMAMVIREGPQDGGRLSLACSDCGYMDGDYGE